jgi:hypothetical protein
VDVTNVTSSSRSGKRVFHDEFTISTQILSVFLVATTTHRSRNMTAKDNFRMTLTPEQKDQIRQVTGKEADILELSVEELEERIAPVTRGGLRKLYPQ